MESYLARGKEGQLGSVFPPKIDLSISGISLQGRLIVSPLKCVL